MSETAYVIASSMVMIGFGLVALAGGIVCLALAVTAWRMTR